MAAFFEALGDVVLKKWALDSNAWILVIGLLVYFAATVLWAYSLRFEYLSKAIAIVTILNLIFVIMIGVIYFKEDISLVNAVGIALGVFSIYLMQV